MSTLADGRAYPYQLARLMADPCLAIHPSRLREFIAGELERLDPFSARVAEVEARYWRMVYQQHTPVEERP